MRNALSWRACVLSASTLLGCLVLSAPAQDPSLAISNLEKARAQYEKANEAARTKLDKAIEKRLNDAQQTGLTEAVAELESEKKAFDQNGTIPGSPRLASDVKSYNSSRRTAMRALVGTLKSAETSLTKAGRTDEAKKLLDERRDLERQIAGDAVIDRLPDPAAAVASGTTWRGFVRGVAKNPGEAKRVRNFGVDLRIRSRSGDQFTGGMKIDGGDGCDIEGWLGPLVNTRNGNYREISFMITRRRDGTGPVGPATTATGVIRGGSWTGEVPIHREGQGVRRATFELSPQ